MGVMPGISPPDSTGTGAVYSVGVGDVKVGVLTVYDFPAVVDVGGVVPDSVADVRVDPLSGSGWGLYFDGVDDYVYVSHSDLLNVQPGNKISIVVWAGLLGWSEGRHVGVLIDKRGEGWSNYNWEFDCGSMIFRTHAGGGYRLFLLGIALAW